MATASTAINGSASHTVKPALIVLSLFNSLFGSFFWDSAVAMEWQLRTNLAMDQTYDDNLNLSQTAPQAGWVSEVAPGLMLTGQSAKSSFNLNYRLQGLYNAQNSDAINIYHQLYMNTLLQPVQNTLYIQASSSISQQNTSNTILATSNISGQNSMTQIESFNIAPYLTPHFGQYATGLLRAGYTDYFYNEPAGVVSNPISNAYTVLTQGGLTSGSYFGVFNWGLNYSSSNQTNANNQASTTGGNTDNVRFENYTANTGYALTRQFSLFTQSGYENNYYATQNNQNQNSFRNGYYYTVGGQWKPSLWYSMQVGLGNNSTANLQFNPDNNLSGNLTYYYKTVGVNLGSSWLANFSYTRNMFNTGFNYNQSTTTVQELVGRQQTIFVTNPVTGVQDTPYIISLPNLVNDVYVVKSGSLYAGYNTGKSSYRLSFYNQRRTDQVTQQLDTLYGISGGWNWSIDPRLNFYLSPSYQIQNSTLTASNNNLYEVTMGLTRGIPIYLGRPLLLNATVQGQHIQQLDGAVGNNYIENRATVGFFVQY